MKWKIMFSWLLAVFLLYLMYQILVKIFGGSWSIESLILALVVAQIGYLIRLDSKLSEHIGWHKGKGDL